MFRYVVLGLLRDGVPRHGYALMKLHRERLGVKLSTGNFYRELARLAVEGLIRASTRIDTSDARQAPYEITAKGADAFDDWFQDARTIARQSSEDELSVRMLFLSTVPREVALDVLAQWESRLWTRAKALEQRRNEALATPAAGGDALPILPIILARRLRHVAADIGLLAELRTAYEQWAALHAPRTAAGARADDVAERAGASRGRNASWRR